MTGMVSSAWVRKNSGPRGTRSPYAYFAAEYVPGTTLLSGGYQRSFRPEELAAEAQAIRGHAGPTAKQYAAVIDDAGEWIGGANVAAEAPATRVNYFTTGAGIRWQLETQVGTTDDLGFMTGPFWRDSPRALRPGERGQQTWGAAPYGVAFDSTTAWIARRHDTIDAVIPQTGDGAGHIGFDHTAETSSRIYRDGTLIGADESASTSADDLPEAESTYRVEQTVRGPGYAGLATERSAAFTFRSARPAGDERVALPVLVVRYQPPLDAANSVPGGAGVVPLRVLDQSGARVPVRTLTAEVSFDDGKTWRPARIGADQVARVTYPKGRGFVSVRLGAADANGSAVTQTVIRAYRIR
jgi:hypothetical protein